GLRIRASRGRAKAIAWALEVCRRAIRWAQRCHAAGWLRPNMAKLTVRAHEGHHAGARGVQACRKSGASAR
ncbi:hypothetical protein PIB30_096093, partial [Stylosanthes scabra]|nr:hypothetical protein [Stylosanthes scabra]